MAGNRMVNGDRQNNRNRDNVPNNDDEGIFDHEDDDLREGQERREENNRRLVLRSLSKPPKEFKFGTNFLEFLDRFKYYCALNNIPDEQKGVLLLTLLDSHSFQIVSNMNLDLLHFDRVGQKLTEKFDSPAGELGNKIGLNSRHQLVNESPVEFLDALIQLAHRTELDLPAQHAKIIEVMMENTNDTGVREKIVNFCQKHKTKHGNQNLPGSNLRYKSKICTELEQFLITQKMLNSHSKPMP